MLGWVVSAWAGLGINADNFPNGIQSHTTNGKVTFGWNGVLETDNQQVRAGSIAQNLSQPTPTCGASGFCQAISPAAPKQDAGSFRSASGPLPSVNVGYRGSAAVNANGSNEYKNWDVGQEATLTVNGNGETFFIDKLDLAYRATLVLGGGDYWIDEIKFSGTEVKIIIPAGETVRIFARKSFSVSFKSIMNYRDAATPGLPEQLFIYAYNDFTVDNQSLVPGYIYSKGKVTIGNAATWKGAITADDVTLESSGARVIYAAPPEPPAPQTCLADDFNRLALGSSDWAVTSRNGSFGAPRIVNNRLRLTDSSGNVATGATIQRLVPATANFVQVQFKYYAYNGSGADGVAMILSDATQTPQPGGYGGSLGYAQNGSISGFAGGWLAVALDEYGNFSNPTEGRVGGPGFRQDSVSVRGSGSGTTGYRYLAGTAANLSPGIDISGSTAGPGHTYRITLDNTVAGKSMLQVERNTGAGFVTLISSFDVLASSGQAALPANFFLTFTGSTGGSNNIHELDDLQVCATQMNAIGQQIDHYEFVHAGNALTCNPLSVEVRACLNADCSLRHTDPTSVTLSPSGWEGGSSRTFSGGTLVDNLRVTTAQTVTLGVSNSNPPLKALSQTLCKVGAAPLSTNCQVAFADSGFIFDVPNLLARKEQTGIALQAVRKDNATQRCVPAFGPATRTLQFWSDYVDPGTGSMAVQVNDTAVSGNAASPTGLSLVFDNQATTQLKVRYDDAGLMQLNARFDGAGLESGLVMTGADQFVSKPYGLHISTPADTSCTVASVSGCSMLRAAGDSFPLSIRAVAWQADGEALTAAALSDNPTTPNFQLNGIALNSMLVEPSVASGGVAGTFYRHAADGTRQAALISYDHAVGASTTLQVGQSEVGIYRITATPPAGTYHTLTVSGGESALIGRFTPAYLGATSTASLEPACGAFSYQGQTINFSAGPPGIVVTGYNRQGAVTNNYDRDPFWRLEAPQRQAYSFSDTSKPDLVSRLQSLGDPQSLAVADSGGADGRRVFDWRADGVRLADALLWRLPSPPTAEDLPFVLTAAGDHVELRVGTSELTDLDGICYLGSAATCQDFVHAFGGTEVRLGRLRIDAASGPENQALDLPYWLESWQASAGGNAFGATTDDSCSLAALGDVVLSDFTGYLQASDFPAPPGTLAAPPASTPTPTGVIRLPAPNKKGSVLASLSGLNGATPALPWLLFDWDGNGTPEAPSALATFGVLSSQRALIFRREIYR
ncbi:MAG TPA: DUF6701 domain-containing protein [Pseudomonas sp.]